MGVMTSPGLWWHQTGEGQWRQQAEANIWGKYVVSG